jgi:hypothetical protein
MKQQEPETIIIIALLCIAHLQHKMADTVLQ